MFVIDLKAAVSPMAEKVCFQIKWSFVMYRKVKQN